MLTTISDMNNLHVDLIKHDLFAIDESKPKMSTRFNLYFVITFQNLLENTSQ